MLAFLSTFVKVNLPGDDDPRPVGTAEDIRNLRDRDDLNVLFVLIDTLRAEHLGSYGYRRDTSPNLDALASKGVRFARHLSQSSWTKCSMASLWTGLFPARSGVTRFDEVLSDEARVPAEILKEAGFYTAGLYRNGWVAPTFGFDQGFDVYTRPTQRPVPPKVRFENPTLTQKGTDDDTVAAAVEFLRINGNEGRWFLYLHMMDVHEYLYDAETSVFGTTYHDIYDNSVHWEDGIVGVLLDYLVSMGHADDTLVVIASDHGEAFRERGYEGHAREVFRETTEVPLIFSFPFRLDPGVVVDVRSRNVDVWPTILDLLGLEPPAGIDGRSLVPEILAAARGETPAGEPRVGIAHLDQHWGQRGQPPAPTVAVTEDGMRYVRVPRPEGPEGDPIEQLFDSASDPAELHDRSAEDPETLERFRAVADRYLESSPPWGQAPTREIDEVELDHLRALGYAVP